MQLETETYMRDIARPFQGVSCPLFLFAHDENNLRFKNNSVGRCPFIPPLPTCRPESPLNPNPGTQHLLVTCLQFFFSISGFAPRECNWTTTKNIASEVTRREESTLASATLVRHHEECPPFPCRKTCS
ncbi:unnamed protein product [Ectocarpus sp. 8 AP-2014]